MVVECHLWSESLRDNKKLLQPDSQNTGLPAIRLNQHRKLTKHFHKGFTSYDLTNYIATHTFTQCMENYVFEGYLSNTVCNILFVVNPKGAVYFSSSGDLPINYV